MQPENLQTISLADGGGSLDGKVCLQGKKLNNIR